MVVFLRYILRILIYEEMHIEIINLNFLMNI